MATFKELCLDSAGDSEALARFWATMTGCRVQADERTPLGDVVGDVEGMGIALCPVPEKKTVKNRIHLDVHVRSLDDVTDAGGRVLDATSFDWAVCQDVEGNEFCAFVRGHELPAYKVYELAVDCRDHRALAQWWADRFGVPMNAEDERWSSIQDVPGCPFESWVFADVPEPKTVKNRLHWDLYGDPADFIAAGASQQYVVPGRTRPIAWTVLADPEGNEFCVFPPLDDDAVLTG